MEKNSFEAVAGDIFFELNEIDQINADTDDLNAVRAPTYDGGF